MSSNNNVKLPPAPDTECGCDPYLLSLIEPKNGEFDKPNSKKNLTGLFLAGATGMAALGMSALCFPFVAPALRRICLPYVPASTAQVENVVRALALSKARGRLIDLGSGDGRIVLISFRTRGYQNYKRYHPLGLCCGPERFSEPRSGA